MERAGDSTADRERYEYWHHHCTGALTLVQQWKEVGGVLGDHGPRLTHGSLQHINVRSTAEADVSDMDSVVPTVHEELGDTLGIHLVD